MSIQNLIATEEEIKTWEEHNKLDPLDKLFVKFTVSPSKMYCEWCGWEIYPKRRFIQTGRTKRFKQCYNQHGLATYHPICLELEERDKKYQMRPNKRVFLTYSERKQHAKVYLKKYYFKNRGHINEVTKQRYIKNNI